MTYSSENSTHDEAAKIRWELVPYFHGDILDIGLTRYKTFPHFIGVGSNRDVRIKDASDLSLFASQQYDGVFSAFTIDQVTYSEVPKMLAEWCRVIKPGGHLMLYLPDAAQYPKAGSGDGDPEHRWDCSYERVVETMRGVQAWDLVDYQQRGGDDEYGLFFAFKIGGTGHRFSHLEPRSAKTCAVVRLGAFGDMIQASSIFPWLKAQGYHLTLYCSASGHDVVKHDPHVDRFILQGPGEVPPQFLTEFWDYAKQKYDRWINLSESVEGSLLPNSDRSSFHWPDEVRAKYLDRNYLEFTHELAQVPPPYQPKFYSTPKEREKARWQAKQWGRRNVLWSLSGSSVHKTWPHLDKVISLILLAYQDVHVVLVGDELSQLLETGWESEPRVHCRSGKWSIRESMAFAEASDLIIGTETGLLNAAGSMEVPKIVTLSHSSKEMLTKHWHNVIALEQPRGVGCHKQPCRQLHSDWTHCNKHEETGTAMCQFHIGPEQMWEAIKAVLGAGEGHFFQPQYDTSCQQKLRAA